MLVYQAILTAVCPDLFAAVWSDSLDDSLLKPPHGGLVNCLSAVCHCLLMAVYPKPLHGDKMAEENVLAPTRTDEQLVPVKARLPIGKGNILMDLQKKQKNPIFLIFNILRKDSKTGVYSFQLDELCFTLNVNLLRKALGITPKDFAHPFVPPLASDLVIHFVNNLGYSKELQFVSKMYVNDLYQPWRTMLSMINQCLTGKTSGGDRHRHLVLQMLWGVIIGTNIDYVELI
ncbi:hypothetical protein Tco_1167253 [Tanacetum coccineum]